MAATKRSSSSLLHPLSSSQRYHHHHHHHQRSSSPCNLNLRLSSVTVSSNHHKVKCLCSPTTHPGSFRCAFHRRLEQDKTKTLISQPKRNSKTNGGLYLRKLALMNSLMKIGTVEAERFRRSLMNSLVKPSFLLVRRRSEFRPQLSRFCDLRKDQE